MLTKITMLRAQPRCFLHRPANAMHWPKLRPLMLVPVPGNKHPFAATLCTAAAKTDQTPQLENQKMIMELGEAVVSSNRRALAKAITLIESDKHEHQKQAHALLSYLAHRKNGSKMRALHSNPSPMASFRLGISGSPGVGKSTFIESFGKKLLEMNHRIAVLAVDPSSVRTGGSILGDKTRMSELSKHPNAYVRPSPSRGTLGGVTRHTSETIALCEAAGYDMIIVETVGVGQSEIAVEDMVDMFLLLVGPGGGDELQGIKKGIMELADAIIINKADGPLQDTARRTQYEYQSALKLIHPKADFWNPKVIACSAMEGNGLDKVIETVDQFHDTIKANGELVRRREDQQKRWLWRIITEDLIERFKRDAGVRTELDRMESSIRQGKTTVGAAADHLLHTFFSASL